MEIMDDIQGCALVQIRPSDYSDFSLEKEKVSKSFSVKNMAPLLLSKALQNPLEPG